MKKAITLVLILTLVPISGLISKVKSTETKEISGTNAFEKEATGNSPKKGHGFGRDMLWVLGISAVAGVVLYFTVIKKNNYTLAVTVGDGVDGNPVTSSQKYKKGTKVSYNFTAKPGFKNLTVTLDGSPIAASGTISMDKNHTLSATALELGNYTSIRLRVRYILKCYNTLQTFTIVSIRNGETPIQGICLGETFSSPKSPTPIDPRINCNSAPIVKDTTVETEINILSVNLTQYYGWVCWDYSIKPTLCSSFEFTILGYTWEQGKADPGSPQIINLESLVLVPETDFTFWNDHFYICDKKTKLDFVSPENPLNAPKVFYVSGGCR